MDSKSRLLLSTAAIILFNLFSYAGDVLSIRNTNLEYLYTVESITGDTTHATVLCSPECDTVIGSIEVLKYRYVLIDSTGSDTSFNYYSVTDSSVVNYAWAGSTPNLLLKQTADSIELEETPYTALIFPFQMNYFWLTRPESTGLYSIKVYTDQTSINVGAGSFSCKKINISILPSFKLTDLYGEQWINGNVIVRAFTNFGGIDTFEGKKWESFELKSFSEITQQIIEPAKQKTTRSSDRFHSGRSYLFNGRVLFPHSGKVTIPYLKSEIVRIPLKN